LLADADAILIVAGNAAVATENISAALEKATARR
jgi:hypothetical protein